MKLDMTKCVQDYLIDLPPKQHKQIFTKMVNLMKNPRPNDYKHLSGHPDCYRIDSGEYRICYKHDTDVVYIIVVGPRNDDKVYKQFERIMQ